MPPTAWNVEQILALAPDAGSAKAGQGLATARKWVSLGASEQVVWGECQGSGQAPYRTQIDLGEPAFRCSCPSRKFPCKHALGLFLLSATQPGLFTETMPPGWVTEWLAARSRRTQEAPQKRAASAATTTDPGAQARRLAAREAKVVAGAQELERWMRDLVRQGLAAAQSRPYGFWETMAARMVDAQAPGLARLVREMSAIPATGEGWQERLLERLGRLFLLLEGFKRLESLPPATQADVRTAIGWSYNQDELLAAAGVRDAWLVAGQHVTEEERLRTQRTWLWGRASGRPALVLHFAHAGQPLDTSLLPGACIEADLVFYPSATPLRALVKERYGVPTAFDRLPASPSVAAAVASYATALAGNPWLERYPLAVGGVVPVRQGASWLVCDAARHALPIHPRFQHAWELAAVSGGSPVTLFGEWDGDVLQPLSVQAADQFVFWGGLS